MGAVLPRAVRFSPSASSGPKRLENFEGRKDRASHLIILVILLLSSVLLLTELSTAQSVYGQVWGRLTSAAGTPVSGAVVNMISVGTGARTGAKSNPDGSFAVSNVSADLYQIEVRADGFKRVEATIVVSANSTTTVNVPLQAGDPNTIVGSTATGASVLQLDRTDVSTLFDSRAIATLPLLNRNITNLQLLVPGAASGQPLHPDQSESTGRTAGQHQRAAFQRQRVSTGRHRKSRSAGGHRGHQSHVGFRRGDEGHNPGLQRRIRTGDSGCGHDPDEKRKQFLARRRRSDFGEPAWGQSE